MGSINSVIAAWSGSAPAEALQWLGRVPDANLRNSMTSRALATWATDDPSQALDYTSKITEPAARSEAQDTIFNTWANSAPDTLAQWITKNPNPATSDNARTQLSTAWADTQPENALAAAGGIRDNERRSEALQTVLANWAEKNPSAAQAYLRRYPALAPLLNQP